MSDYAQPAFVTTPLIRRRRWRMVEQLKDLKDVKLPIIGMVALLLLSAAGGLVTPFLWLTGSIAGSTIVNDRLTAISNDIVQIKADLKTVPRGDQVQEMARTNAQQDAKIEVMRDEINALKIELARLAVRMDGVSSASTRALPGDHR